MEWLNFYNNAKFYAALYHRCRLTNHICRIVETVSGDSQSNAPQDFWLQGTGG